MAVILLLAGAILIIFLITRKPSRPSRDTELVLATLGSVAEIILLMSTSLDTLTQAVADNTAAVQALTASVDAAVVDIGQGSAGDAALDALSQVVTNSTGILQAQQARLDTAVAAVTVTAPSV